MIDREKIIKALSDFTEKRICLPDLIPWEEIGDAIVLLKEQDEQKHKWLVNIADNQLANAPDERYREEWDYKKGVYDGLQMAWEILTEGR